MDPVINEEEMVSATEPVPKNGRSNDNTDSLDLDYNNHSTSNSNSSSDNSSNSGKKRFLVSNRTFPQLLEHCKKSRQRLSQSVCQGQFSSFTFHRRPIASVTRLYSIGRLNEVSDNRLLYLDLFDSYYANLQNATSSPSSLYWKALDENTDMANRCQKTMSKEEELLRQRLRQLTGGISSYLFDKSSSRFLFSSCSQLNLLTDDDHFENASVEKLELPMEFSGAQMDPQFCPSNSSLISFVLKNDLYVQYGQCAKRITFAKTKENPDKSAGVASYIVQEEFDRYTGYWWSPKRRDSTHYILYEEIDSSGVELISINSPADLSTDVELMRYPRPGKPNDRWDLKMIKIAGIPETVNDRLAMNETLVTSTLYCAYDLHTLFPWAEYMVRAGWMPNSEGVWVQLMSRLQRKTALIFIPLELFIEDIDQWSRMVDSHPKIAVLYEEETPDCIVKTHNCMKVLQSNIVNGGLGVKFLWCHVRSGFSHLYFVESTLKLQIIDNHNDGNDADPSNPLNDMDGGSNDGNFNSAASKNLAFCQHTEKALTSGQWEVCWKLRPYVDLKRQLVYFLGLKDSPLESHIYCLSLEANASNPTEPKRLTEPGFSYGNARGDVKAFSLNEQGQFMVTCRSNISSPGQCLLYNLSYSGGENGPPDAHFVAVLSSVARDEKLDSSPKAKEPKIATPSPPEILTYTSPSTGWLHYACVWRPVNFNADVKYATILSVYAGPEVQMIKNSFAGSLNVSKFTDLGYVVVMLDGRGSTNRGIAFERELWGNMGSIEIDDQVEGLHCISDIAKCIDLQRVAIIGWSYGGYASLVALARFQSVFKVAIAGAPVTTWDLYDTGYTERFMGLPDPLLGRYPGGSVLDLAPSLPDTPGRLLLLHGVLDENVHFAHTLQLVRAMTRHGKPYRLQVFPAERHAVRSLDTTLHMEATVLHFLQENL